IEVLDTPSDVAAVVVKRREMWLNLVQEFMRYLLKQACKQLRLHVGKLICKKKPSRPVLGHVYHLVPDVEGLWCKLWKLEM
ncbi:hypothetical protein Tco_1472008, partial [Tanacetum coccineum]